MWPRVSVGASVSVCVCWIAGNNMPKSSESKSNNTGCQRAERSKWRRPFLAFVRASPPPPPLSHSPRNPTPPMHTHTHTLYICICRAGKSKSKSLWRGFGSRLKLNLTASLLTALLCPPAPSRHHPSRTLLLSPDSLRLLAGVFCVSLCASHALSFWRVLRFPGEFGCSRGTLKR